MAERENAYMRNRRHAHPELREREKRYLWLRQRALTQLAREYPARYFEIFEALKALDETGGIPGA